MTITQAMRLPVLLTSLYLDTNFNRQYVQYAASQYEQTHCTLMHSQVAYDPRESPLSHYPVKYYADTDNTSPTFNSWINTYLMKI